MIADSIIVRNSSFVDNNANTFLLADEKEDKGYYSAEKIYIGHNLFRSQSGTLLNLYRGGNDESTLGPLLSFSHNQVKNCQSQDGKALIQLTGVQVSHLFSNEFTNSNASGALILYKDTVRARHGFEMNKLSQSGIVTSNQFVTQKNNRIQ